MVWGDTGVDRARRLLDDRAEAVVRAARDVGTGLVVHAVGARRDALIEIMT